MLKDFGCTAVWSVMHVGPHGDVFPCYSYNMGNVREMTVQQIWNGERYRDFRRELKAAGVFPGCVGCCVMKYEPARTN
jgi:radical SAM protein with 4Fe4S-binding SPASM domain